MTGMIRSQIQLKWASLTGWPGWASEIRDIIECRHPVGSWRVALLSHQKVRVKVVQASYQHASHLRFVHSGSCTCWWDDILAWEYPQQSLLGKGTWLPYWMLCHCYLTLDKHLKINRCKIRLMDQQWWPKSCNHENIFILTQAMVLL